MIWRCVVVILVLVSVKAYSAAKMELGAGVFYADIPHYLGSDESEKYLLPVPYFRYQSEKMAIDRNNFTGYLWQHENLHLDLSAGVGLAVDSKDNKAREGMDDLDWVFELGPSLNYYVIGEPNSKEHMYFSLFVRKAIATDFGDVDDIGWRYGPSIYYTIPLLEQAHSQFSVAFRGNVNFATERYLDYYYAVNEIESNATRQIYASRSGFSGADVSIGLHFDTPNYWLGGFVKYHHLANSQQHASPLVKQDYNVSIGFGVAWKFYRKHF
ncbi:outer membrane protein [Pseudoalteromonas sp. MBR-15]|jgi:outer membrane scaffolding protein for murein synthesis (MipA/OmpV family)